MDLRIAIEPQQGASHEQMLAVATATRAGGFSGFFRSDHVLAMGSGDGLPGPSEAMVSLAAIAVAVPDIRLGTMVTSATFRHPSMLAIAAANVDDISGGRLELGMGAGWFEAEHTAYGLPFGSSFGERFDRLTEQLEILTGLWGTAKGATFNHTGKHFTLRDAPGLPKPVQLSRTGIPKVPIIIGGRGPKRTPALTARFADESNVGFVSAEVTAAQYKVVRAACETVGRDPDELVYSSELPVCCGSTRAELERRASVIGLDPDDLTSANLVGSPAQIVDKLGAYANAGVQRMYLQFVDLDDLDHLALIAEEVRPAAG